MLIAGSGGLIMADHLSYLAVYGILAACLIPGIITTLLTPEPATPFGTPTNYKEAVVDPFVEYFRRSGAIWM